jgi:hypothetical protein
LKQPHGYAQLFAAILEQLKVLEVAGQADVPEYGLLELDARLNKVAVQIEGRDLAREVRVGGLQPVDVVLVFLHDFDEPLHISGFLQLTNFAFLHDTELCDVYDFHVEFRGFLDLLLQITWKKKINYSMWTHASLLVWFGIFLSSWCRSASARRL